jgi:hypothetical protein
MKDHMKVVVYVRAPDTRMLRGQGVDDVPLWVRMVVNEALEEERKGIDKRKGA